MGQKITSKCQKLCIMDDLSYNQRQNNNNLDNNLRKYDYYIVQVL